MVNLFFKNRRKKNLFSTGSTLFISGKRFFTLKKQTILFGWILMISSTAHASGFDLLGAVTYPMAKGDGIIDPSGTISYESGGIRFNFDSGRRTQFEMATLYMSRSYVTDVKQTTRELEGQVGFKYYLARGWYINMGGYTTRQIASSEGFTGTNSGVYAGIAAKVTLGRGFNFIMNPQYQYALTKLTAGDGSYTITPSGFVGLAGFNFGF